MLVPLSVSHCIWKQSYQNRQSNLCQQLFVTEFISFFCPLPGWLSLVKVCCVWKASSVLNRAIPWPWVCGYLHQLSKKALTSIHPSTSWQMWVTSSVSWSCLRRRPWWWWSLTVSIETSEWPHMSQCFLHSLCFILSYEFVLHIFT